MDDDPRRLPGERVPDSIVKKVSRDPLALGAIAVVVVQLFTRITFDVVLSLALIGLIVLLAARSRD